ncbi:MAG: divalent cation tolerance protein CutA [Myxococcales bacterium]|nr:divalent cation tolerance protein CutA [Polyangiaceae bacterium]MDW8250131.1 divalent cation tolerance protein CutA [Myxococcales bacterium]
MKLAFTNCPPDHAERIACALVEERLAACVNAFPVKSVYRWKGELQKDEEVTLLIKVASDKVGALRAKLLALHPYELPEFLVFDVDTASSLEAYISWVQQEG